MNGVAWDAAPSCRVRRCAICLWVNVLTASACPFCTFSSDGFEGGPHLFPVRNGSSCIRWLQTVLQGGALAVQQRSGHQKRSRLDGKTVLAFVLYSFDCSKKTTGMAVSTHHTLPAGANAKRSGWVRPSCPAQSRLSHHPVIHLICVQLEHPHRATCSRKLTSWPLPPHRGTAPPQPDTTEMYLLAVLHPGDGRGHHNGAGLELPHHPCWSWHRRPQVASGVPQNTRSLVVITPPQRGFCS